jgi:membrane fusion protein, multidrug efflux system
MKKNLIFTIAGIIILVLSITVSMGLIQSKPVPSKDGHRENLLTVKTASVEYENLTTSFSYQGRMEALENISLAAEVNGQILQGEISFREGQNFEKGNLLIQIYNKNAEASLIAARSNFLRTLSLILPDMMIDYPDRYLTWKNYFNSIDLKEPPPEMPEITQEKEKIFLASNNVLTEYYSLKQQEITFEKYSIYAPFNGYFKQVNREVGSIAANGSELAVIVRSELLEIKVPVFPTDAKKVHAGQDVEIKSKSDKIYSGKVSRVSQFVDASTQSVNVYVTFQQVKGNSLLEGEYVTVNFQNAGTTKGMQIPREALVAEKYIYLVKENKLEKSEVSINQTLEDYVVINGLPEGQEIVTESLINASDGMSVLTR